MIKKKGTAKNLRIQPLTHLPWGENRSLWGAPRASVLAPAGNAKKTCELQTRPPPQGTGADSFRTSLPPPGAGANTSKQARPYRARVMIQTLTKLT